MNISIKGAALGAALATALTTGAANAQDTIDLKISYAFPPTHYLIEHGLDIWVAGVKEDLGDRVDFTIYPAQQLGKAAEGLDLVSNGAADLVLTATSYHPTQITVSGVAELPGMFSDICVATRASMELSREGALFDNVDFDPNGVRAIYNVSLPIYNVVTATRKVEKLEDFEGLKLRTTGAAMDLTARTLGAAAVRMPSAELFQAAQRGTVDGALYLYAGMRPYDLQTVFKHSTEGVSMGSTHLVLLMNREKFDSLPDDVQEVFLRYGVAAAENNCAWMAENDSLVRDKMVDEAGLEVIKLGAEEAARWKERTSAVAADWAASVGEHGAEAVDAYTAAVGRIAAKN
ncbi:MAG: TRAP transporter substrate-binding protein DctP [Antarcticimicrobium sp.]|uniref:TRAP transporter substrate-binding protein DctP n=1 Tax=Antarcticimicrobium sp. TaxID=2824147 RepID=UPI002638A064|nr:TRAP transporter substrate-binding protein DctP [Antarcticimicrobium sp.]MDF1716030.1 TRAP transporter substrate-binding protein DctP [Antarcticimicrobium sp.]